jgi:hypothetical protein
MRRKNTKFIDPRYFMDEKMELVTEDREQIAQIARDLISGKINEADAIQLVSAYPGKDRDWAKNWVTLVQNNPGMFSE